MGPVSEGLFAWLVGIGLCVAAAVWIAAHTTRSSKSKVEA
jgi:ubiquinol-cytochrome c reductase cytochrome c subunit